jgi:sarcosine oxidase subunit alpha
VHAGAWYRPEYYHRGHASRAKRILDEARAVRSKLGLIDLSTLGKLWLVGPGAVDLLERLYIGRFKKLAVGRQRYAVALDESGVVIEDGVVARVGEDRFYVTTTSGGVDAFYREMQRWVVIWGLDVTLLNATGQNAAMNLVGPKSREALAALTECDLAETAFPYLGVREAAVAGVSAILLRVGFLGELGYELHVPASRGMHVWTSLLEAGASLEIEPFGVEAQRLLRLEKGHLIVGHDSDALTVPAEVSLRRAVAKEKPFFVGQRSLSIVDKKPHERILVGIRWPVGHNGPLPEECQLIVRGDKIVGRVTSIAAQSTLGYPLGLAFVRPDRAEPGTPVSVRLGRGRSTEATVTPLCHYDPENHRQRA